MAIRVLHVATECAPLAKAGGLADVVAGLAKVQRGGASAGSIEASVLLPAYGQLAGAAEERVAEGAVQVEERALAYSIWAARRQTTPFPLFLVKQDLFAPEAVYPDGPALPRNTVLAHAAVTLARGSRDRTLEGIPRFDVMHVHDHHPALACVWLRHRGPSSGMPTVLTVHNARYTGACDWSDLEELDLPRAWSRSEGDHDGRFNSLKAGLTSASRVTTVSPTHARELCDQPHASHGLDYVFRSLGGRLAGILNGIDTEVWNPATDPHLPATYTAADLGGKAACKAAVCREHGLDPARPLLVHVGRMVPEKGTVQLLEALPRLFARDGDVQAIVLGSGERHLQDWLLHLEAVELPGRVRAAIRVDEALAHRLFAAADVFVAPSWYEPCGLTQMYAMRYGAIPVVFPVGGLRDSVVPFDPSTGRGHGVWMERHDTPALEEALVRALTWWRDPALRAKLTANGMAADFSWEASAAKHGSLYQSLLEAS